MQKTYLANIKIPFTIMADGSMTPHQDRYAIDFQSIDELPPINHTEYGALLQQLLSSTNNTITQNDESSIENKSEGDKSEGDKSEGDKSEGDKSEGDKSEHQNQLMVSIHELMNRPPPQQRNNISFKHKTRISRITHTAKKRSNPANDLHIVSGI